MSEIGSIERAFIIPGFSESKSFAEPFANALHRGEHLPAIMQPEILPIADLLADPHKYEEELAESLVFTHSLGFIGLKRAKDVIVLNGVEPTPFPRTILGALKVSFADNSDREDGIKVPLPTQPGFELARHPVVNAKAAWATRNFSSSTKLINGGAEFPGARMMFQFDQDEFGFTREPSVALAQHYGVHADILEGKHNEPMYRPENTLRQIAASVTAARR